MNKTIVLPLLLLITLGCAAPQCHPLHPYKIGGMTIYPVICPVERMNTVCRHSDPDTIVNACAWHQKGGKKCWIMAADSVGGAKAVFHEHAHCAGGDENTARCDDWTGEDGAPEGEFCDHPWPRGLK